MKKNLPVFIILTAFLSGCATQPPVTREQPEEPLLAEPVPVERDIEELLAMAERSAPRQARELRIEAAEIAIAGADAEHAEVIMDLIEDPVDTPRLIRRYVFLQAKLALLRHEPYEAIEWTQDPRLRSLDQEDQIELGEIRARAFSQARSYVASAKERISYDNLLSPDDRARNHERIFATLLNLPADSLANQAKEAMTSDVRGWLSLAAMTKRYQDSPLRQLEELKNWQLIWSHHPAASQLPAGLEMLSTVVSEQPEIIALLLPLQGDLGPYGRAIRDGIVGAHYQLTGKPEIRIYDTAEHRDITLLIHQVAREGAELIIGPLSRDKVTQIAGLSGLTVPVLALNRTIDGSVNPNLYQFGLAPEDEMIQVANQVYEEGLSQALAIYPDDEWGRRNYEAFKAHWEALGGTIVDSAGFSRRRDYSDLVKTLLNVDESEKRATELRRITGQRFEFTPRRRQDADFVFLLANQDQARGINPTLAFYYAEDLPVYATSHVHESSDSRIDTIDLNGIRFCDIPWKLIDTGAVQQAIQSIWDAASSRLASFYALGVDAYRLYPRLQQLRKIPDQRVYGGTGVLRLDDRNVVIRDLMWGQFKEGKVLSVPMIVGGTRNP